MASVGIRSAGRLRTLIQFKAAALMAKSEQRSDESTIGETFDRMGWTDEDIYTKIAEMKGY